MGDIIVLGILAIIVILIINGMVKSHREGVSVACKSCSVVKNKSSNNQIPLWVKQYKESKIDE